VRKKLNGKGIGEIARKRLALPADPGSPINNCGDLGSVARKGVKEREAGKYWAQRWWGNWKDHIEDGHGRKGAILRQHCRGQEEECC